MDELIIKEQETREKLVKVFNESTLPAFILEPMVREFHEQLLREKEEQYQQAKVSLEQKKDKKKEDK